MLPGATPISLVQHYLKAQEGVTEVTRISADDVRYTVGERVHATVASLLPNGRFAVLIKDQLLDLNLPRNTEPGEKLDLTVVSNNPKLTFSINTAATPQPALPQEMALSQGAKFLTSLFAKGEVGKEGLTSVLKQAQPLFEGSPDTAKLADKLAQKLADSGLFYESHQAEWVNGERPLQALLKEPQAGLLKPTLFATAADVAEKIAVPASKEGSEKTALASDAGATLRHLVQQQLDVIEQRPIVWNGQAWPGQPVRWEVENEYEREAHAESDKVQRSWQSRMDLQLPNLGDVGIVAVLRNGEFSLRFEASPETAEKIRAETQSLQNRFEAAGLTLVSSQVVAAESVNVT
jgi:hypothetical protein